MKKILIVEDEKSISEYIKTACLNCFEPNTIHINQSYNVEDALAFIEAKQIDLLLLDLNLNHANGFDLLKMFNAYPFFTIIISAHKEKAIEAFEYGVVDFVPKPFKEERLKHAINRCFKKESPKRTKYLTVKSGSDYRLLDTSAVIYFEAADVYVEAICLNGKRELLNQSMKKLETILPENFLRTHRRFIIDLNAMKSFSYVEGGKYELTLKDETILPLSRSAYKTLKSDVGRTDMSFT